MSRVGRMPIPVPERVKVLLEDDRVVIEGPKGSLSQKIPEGIKVSLEDGQIKVEKEAEHRRHRALHGLTRTLIANMVKGVTEGFKKELEIVGVGYRAEVQGRALRLSVGYSYPVLFNIPEGISIRVEKQTTIIVEGIDKQAVGQVAAEIRDFRRPDPYKGKGIKYAGESIRRKMGKASVGVR